MNYINQSRKGFSFPTTTSANEPTYIGEKESYITLLKFERNQRKWIRESKEDEGRTCGLEVSFRQCGAKKQTIFD